MTETINAIVAAAGEAGIVARREISMRKPWSNEAVVRVTAFSVNRGECRRAEGATEAMQIGWDFVGVVERVAEDGSGPNAGQRVVGFSPRMEGWAEKVAISTRYIAPIPDGVSDAQAATLPVAGLTALHSLDEGRSLLGNRVLVTGATGGVGVFAVQLARLAGADVTAQIRRPDQVAFLESLGDCTPLISSDGEGIEEAGPFRLVIDGVSGGVLNAGVRSLGADGVCVCYGVTSAPTIDLDIRGFMTTGMARIVGFFLYDKSESAPPSEHLGRLLRLMAEGRLHCPVEREADWAETDEIVHGLINRSFSGKAVLHIG